MSRINKWCRILRLKVIQMYAKKQRKEPIKTFENQDWKKYKQKQACQTKNKHSLPHRYFSCS